MKDIFLCIKRGRLENIIIADKTFIDNNVDIKTQYDTFIDASKMVSRPPIGCWFTNGQWELKSLNGDQAAEWKIDEYGLVWKKGNKIGDETVFLGKTGDEFLSILYLKRGALDF